MAKKIKKIEKPEEDFLDLISLAGISLENIEAERESKYKDVKKTLCKYKGFIRILRDEESVNKYIEICLKNGIVALDTETNNSLDVHDNIMVGLCLYTPYTRPVYIPVNHRDKVTNELSLGQVSMSFLHSKLELLATIKIIYHNAKFDINVIRKNFGIHLPLYWDTLIGAKILDENRFSNGLKALYQEEIEPTQANYHVTTFFEDNTHADIDDFGLYSAIDSYDTYQVYKVQEKELSAPTMSKLRSLLVDLEFKVTEACADMEWRGFDFDDDLCKNYIITESAKLKKLKDKIDEILLPLKDKILAWSSLPVQKVEKIDEETGAKIYKRVKRTVWKYGKEVVEWVNSDEFEMVKDPYGGVRMDWPVLLTSPVQVLCLFNRILGVPCLSTTVDDLNKLGMPIATLIGKYRHMNHNLTSFFLPYLELQKNGRMYATFNQMGDEDKTVKTGRFSSKEPNLQQLPARQGEDGVRLCFKAKRDEEEIVEVEDRMTLHFTDKVETRVGLVRISELGVGDEIISEGGPVMVKSISREGEKVCIRF